MRTRRRPGPARSETQDSAGGFRNSALVPLVLARCNTGCGAVWSRASFGTKRSWGQIPPPRPSVRHSNPRPERPQAWVFGLNTACSGRFLVVWGSSAGSEAACQVWCLRSHDPLRPHGLSHQGPRCTQAPPPRHQRLPTLFLRAPARASSRPRSCRSPFVRQRGDGSPLSVVEESSAGTSRPAVRRHQGRTPATGREPRHPDKTCP